MNASAVIFSLILAMFAVVSGLPALNELKQNELTAAQEDPQGSEEIAFAQDSAEVTGLRFPRATCDILSLSTPWGSVNHSACALHCISMNKGFKGGRCKDGVCHCRK